MLKLLLVCALGGSPFTTLNINSVNRINEENTPESPTTTSDEDEGETFYSLDEYNAAWSASKYQASFSNAPALNPFSLSPVKVAGGSFIAGDGSVIGHITLQYQTEIQGGRPQFVYDTCYLSAPVSENGWGCTDSHFEFSGDCIRVYAAFVFGAFEESGVATFYPN